VCVRLQHAQTRSACAQFTGLKAAAPFAADFSVQAALAKSG
jgi:hypothetical protein